MIPNLNETMIRITGQNVLRDEHPWCNGTTHHQPFLRLARPAISAPVGHGSLISTGASTRARTRFPLRRHAPIVSHSSEDADKVKKHGAEIESILKVFILFLFCREAAQQGSELQMIVRLSRENIVFKWVKIRVPPFTFLRVLHYVLFCL
jgi:hypothetical protein